MMPSLNWLTRIMQGLGGVALGVASAPAIAWAHGAQIQSRQASAVEIQASYDSGEPMAAAQVQVFAPTDPQTPVLTGVTDDQGQFIFIPDSPGDWEVSVRQAGHGDIAVIAVADSGAIAPTLVQASGLTIWQRGVVIGAVTWGCVGTALYFRRGNQ